MFKYLLTIALIIFITACDQKPKTVQGLDAAGIDFKNYQGKWLVINYWADWCSHCIKELPEINKFYLAHQADVKVFGVNYDHLSPEKLQRVVKKLNIKFPMLTVDPAAQLGLGNVDIIPAIFIINPQGKLAKTLLGEQTQKTLEAAVGIKS